MGGTVRMIEELKAGVGVDVPQLLEDFSRGRQAQPAPAQRK